MTKKIAKRDFPAGRLVRATGAIDAAIGENRTFPFVFSDDSVDRYGDTIDARGWILDKYMTNPVVLFGHDAGTVENIIGRASNVRVVGGKLLGDITLMSGDINPNAESVYQMLRNHFLSTVSVGFQPIAWVATKDKSRPQGVDFIKQELLEVSICPIPANPNALIQARAAGIDIARLGLKVEEVTAPVKKGLFHVSALARLLAELGWLEDDVEWEAECEADGSTVPSMLTDALKQLGAALVAMTTEEVAELLGDEDAGVVEIDVDGTVLMSAGQKALVAMVRREAPLAAVTIEPFDYEGTIDAAVAKAIGTHIGKAAAAEGGERRYVLQTPEAITTEAAERLKVNFKLWRDSTDSALVLERGMTLTVLDNVTRAGRVLSSANEASLRDAHATIMAGCDTLKSVVEAATPAPEAEVADDAGLLTAAASAARKRKARALAAKTKLIQAAE